MSCPLRHSYKPLGHFCRTEELPGNQPTKATLCSAATCAENCIIRVVLARWLLIELTSNKSPRKPLNGLLLVTIMPRTSSPCLSPGHLLLPAGGSFFAHPVPDSAWCRKHPASMQRCIPVVLVNAKPVLLRSHKTRMNHAAIRLFSS